MTQTVTLPIPPSTNELFIALDKRRRIVSPPYAAWRKDAGKMLDAAKLRVPGTVYVLIRIGKCNRGRDADNFCKPVCDLLVTHGVIDSDNLTTVMSVTAEQAFETVDAGMVEVCVSPAIARGTERLRGAA